MASVLALWTVVIWGSRVRNVVVDDDLTAIERGSGLAVGVVFVGLGLALVTAIVMDSRHVRPVLGVLVVAGVVRWTIRGPMILAGSEWSAAFKTVHTMLWVVTVALSLLAWRELRSSRWASSSP